MTSEAQQIVKTNCFGQDALTKNGHHITIIAEDQDHYYFCPPKEFKAFEGRVNPINYASDNGFKIKKEELLEFSQVIIDDMKFYEKIIEDYKKKQAYFMEKRNKSYAMLQQFKPRTEAEIHA